MKDEKLDKDRLLKELVKENAQLKEANHILEHLFHSPGVGKRLIDTNFNVIRVNKTHETMFTGNNEDTSERKCYELFNCSLCGTGQCPVASALNGVEYVQEIVKKDLPDGTIAIYEVVAQPMYNLEGKLLGAVEYFRDITKRTQALEAAQTSGRRFKSYINQSPDGIIVMDEAGNHVAVNPAVCELLGYDEQELLLMSVRDLSASKKLNHFNKLVKKGISKGEVRLFKKDGSLVDIDLHAGGLEDGGYIGFFRDATDRKQAEEAMKWEVEFNAVIAELAHMFLSTTEVEQIASVLLEKAASLTDSEFGYNGFIDTKTGFLTWSNVIGNVAKMNRINKENIVFREFWGLWGWVLENKKSLLTNVPSEDPRFIGVPSWHVPIKRFLSVPALIDNVLVGQITVINSSRDYTERDLKVLQGLADIYAIALQRRWMEQKVLESEQQYNLILNGIRDDVALYEVIDEQNFRFLKINNSILKTVGLSESQVLGKFIQDVIPKEVAGVWIDSNRRAVRSQKMIVSEVQVPHYGIFEVKYIPILDEHGDCSHLIVVAENITERKKAEEHLFKMQKLESVGVLAGGIAHDFNNILTAITGNVSLAKLKINNLDCPGIESLLNLLSEAENASLQAKNLTQQLLTFAKGGVPILKTTAISELLKETAEFALRGSNVKFVSEIPTDLWAAEVDEGQISQVIHNLILNADQAMPGGGIIEIKAENTLINVESPLPLSEGMYVKISIKDNGVGIPREHLSNIFDPYFSTKQRGSGLGLTSSYSIIRKHCGLIEVDSEIGIGTTFQIYLPATTSLIQKKHTNSQLTTGKGRVLVMDDEKMLRYVLSEMLQHLGYEVACAKDGTEAIDLYSEAQKHKQPFDAVVMDLTVPGGMGGKEAIQKLLEIDPQVAAIVSSGYSNDPVMAEHQNYGFKEVVNKPFSVGELAEVIGRVIGNR